MSETNTWDFDQIESWADLAKNGDRRAFEMIYDTMTDSVYRFTLAKVRDHEMAEDITAETWKKVWLSLEKRYERDKFVGYVFRIAYTTTIDYLRSVQRKPSTTLNEEISGNVEDWGAEIDRKDQISMLKKAMEKLASPFREIVWLRFVEDLSVSETAQALELSQVKVRVYQHRALKKLRSLVVT